MAFRDFDTSQAFSRVRLGWHAREELRVAFGSRAHAHRRNSADRRNIADRDEMDSGRLED